jgi:sugar/nucleoside kinase (ribokinase family)
VRDTLELHLNVLAGFVPRLPESYRDAEYVFLGNIDPLMQAEVLNQIRAAKLVVCDTMDHWIRESPEELRKVLNRIEILVINDSEAKLLSGYNNIVQAARAILKMGPKVVLIKRGEYGVLQFSDGSVFATPAYPLEEVFDPTGAGDSFAGGFLGQLARSGDHSERGLRRAIVYGSVVASFTVEDFGVKRLTGVGLEDIEERYRSFAKLTDFHT